MLHMLRLLVHLVPRKVERLAQELLDKAMPAKDPQCERASRRRQPYAFVGRISCEVALVERLQHARHRPRQNAERDCNLPSGNSAAFCTLRELINRFYVVLDGQARHGSEARDEGYWMLN